MRVLKSSYRRALAILFIASMIGPFPVLRATETATGTWTGTGQPIVITFGQPNIWSLEQAHYLLARMRSQALKLQSKEFAAGDLDPNEVNSTRLNALKELLGISVGFNQGIGFQNDQAKKELTFNQDRRHTLLAQRDTRQAELRTVIEQLGTLRVERERMNQSKTTTDEEKKTKDVEIEQKIQQQTELTGEIQSLTSEINGITATSTALSSPSPPSPVSSPFADSVADTLLKGNDLKQQLGNSPKLDASTKLDNYLNLQYEIIAKQLAVMRDEVGPGQRLVFVELPQSFYTVPDKANRMVAQVWWHIDRLYERKSDSDNSHVDCRDDNEYNLLAPNPEAYALRLRCNPYGKTDRPESEEEVIKVAQAFRKEAKDLTNDDKGLVAHWKKTEETNARTLDLIPRQSALNVNDIQDRQKNFNLMGLFSWLSGWGISVNYQRQREMYQQFLQQEVYASAFGKGTRDFGWTFGPKPGTERIAPGLQNTYAVLVVPETAYALTLKATGCYFPRTAYAPASFEEASKPNDLDDIRRCDKTEKPFDLVIPSTTQNNFWVTGLQYRPVRPGQRVIVHVSGEYFSPQIGVLVNGVALRHSIGLAQSELAVTRTDSSFEPTPVGDFEFVNSKQLVLAFSLGDFKGTPTITLVTPGRARVINSLRLVINNSYKCAKTDVGKPNCPQAAHSPGGDPVPYKKLPEDPATVDGKDSIWVTLDSQPAMFSDVTPAPVLSIDSLNLVDTSGPTFVGQLTGSKFNDKTKIFVNNVAIKNPAQLASGLFEINFPATDAPNLEVTVIDGEAKPEEAAYATKSFPNPTLIRVDKLMVTDYKADAKPRPILNVSLEGVGFNHVSRTEVTGGKITRAKMSATSMALEIRLLPKKETILISLHDQRNTNNVISIPVDVPTEAASASADSIKNGESSASEKPAEPTKPRTKRKTRRKATKSSTSTQQSPQPTKP